MLTITDARKIVGRELGYGSTFSGEIAAYSALAPEQKVRLNHEVNRFIADNPSQFTTDQVLLAERWMANNPTYKPLLDTSFDWSMFGNEMLNNARDINPLDPKNIGKTGFSLLLAAVALGGLYIYLNKKK